MCNISCIITTLSGLLWYILNWLYTYLDKYYIHYTCPSLFQSLDISTFRCVYYHGGHAGSSSWAASSAQGCNVKECERVHKSESLTDFLLGLDCASSVCLLRYKYLQPTISTVCTKYNRLSIISNFFCNYVLLLFTKIPPQSCNDFYIHPTVRLWINSCHRLTGIGMIPILLIARKKIYTYSDKSREEWISLLSFFSALSRKERILLQ